MLSFHNKLSIPSLLSLVRSIFSDIQDHRKKNVVISLTDALMSALAMFSFKYPSLLKFDEERNKELVKQNLKNLYDVDNAPCDTQMRSILDPVEPEELRKPFVALLNQFQESGELEKFKFLDKYFIVSLDATGYFSSGAINCAECCEKNHKNGDTTYYHQLLAAAIVHPDKKTVIPFAPEAIIKEINATKNDCELNAAYRLINQIKREHPNLPLLFVEDALYGKAPHIKLLISLGHNYIINVKKGDHKYLFNCVQQKIIAQEDKTLEIYDEKEKITRKFRFINELSLNKSNLDVLVNFLEYWEVDQNNKTVCYFTWISGLSLTKENVYQIMRAGRSRWKVENEIFNTLKNQGYNLEHNYGHGEQHLATNFGMLMMLTFLIDQIQECCCDIFVEVLDKFRTKTYVWHKMQALLITYFISDWVNLYLSIIYDHKPCKLEPDTDMKWFLNTS